VEKKPLLELAERLQKAHQIKVIQTSRGFKEFIRRKLDLGVREICQQYGINGPLRLDYLNYARKIVGRTLKEVWPRNLEITLEEYKRLIDMITQLVRDLHTKRFPLREEPMKEIEKLAKKTLLSIDKLAREYTRMVYGSQN